MVKRMLLIAIVALLFAGCAQQQQDAANIQVKPSAGSYIPEGTHKNSSLWLINYTVEVSTIEEGFVGYYKSNEPVYIIEPGEKAIVIKGMVESRYNESKYVILSAKGFNPSGELVAEYVGKGAPGTAPTRGDYFNIEDGKEESFKLIMRYQENISTIRLSASIHEQPIP